MSNIMIKNIAVAIVLLFMFGYLFYKIGKRQLTGYLFKREGLHTRCLILHAHKPLSKNFELST